MFLLNNVKREKKTFATNVSTFWMAHPQALWLIFDNTTTVGVKSPFMPYIMVAQWLELLPHSKKIRVSDFKSTDLVRG